MACDARRGCLNGRMKVVVAYGVGQMRGTRIAFGRAQRLRSAATRILAKACPCGQWRADAARFRATGSPQRRVAVTHAGCRRSTRLHHQPASRGGNRRNGTYDLGHTHTSFALSDESAIGCTAGPRAREIAWIGSGDMLVAVDFALAYAGRNEKDYRRMLEADSARPRGGDGRPVTNPTHAG